MISCKDITEKANDYIDRELPLLTRMKMKIHLFACIHCQRYVSQLQITILALRKMKKEHSVDENTVDNIVNNLKNYKQNEPEIK
ncbi:MAG: zf-HC2 domain-containing protein [Gammaproteobacteria bacterium]|nr:zf-HC2 domain-containing protein [Gammaproteobacteria bacterium]